MKQLLILMVRAYQAALAPLLGGGCRFHPSCSHYAVEAIERHGAARGAWLAMKRLLRCRPFVADGYDPVPENLPRAVATISAAEDTSPWHAQQAALGKAAESRRTPWERAQ